MIDSLSQSLSPMGMLIIIMIVMHANRSMHQQHCPLLSLGG